MQELQRQAVKEGLHVTNEGENIEREEDSDLWKDLRQG